MFSGFVIVSELQIKILIFTIHEFRLKFDRFGEFMLAFKVEI